MNPKILIIKNNLCLFGGAIRKITLIILAVLAYWAALDNVLATRAFLSDAEPAIGNHWSAGTLFLRHDSVSDFTPEIMPGGQASRVVSIESAGTIKAVYSVAIGNFSGDIDLCNVLDLKVEVDGKPVYKGLLTAFESVLDQYPADLPAQWQFISEINSRDKGLQGKNCYFELSFNAKQSGGVGFTHNATVGSVITTGFWESNFALMGLDDYLNASTTEPFGKMGAGEIGIPEEIIDSEDGVIAADEASNAEGGNPNLKYQTAGKEDVLAISETAEDKEPDDGAIFTELKEESPVMLELECGVLPDDNAKNDVPLNTPTEKTVFLEPAEPPIDEGTAVKNSTESPNI